MLYRNNYFKPTLRNQSPFGKFSGFTLNRTLVLVLISSQLLGCGLFGRSGPAGDDEDRFDSQGYVLNRAKSSGRSVAQTIKKLPQLKLPSVVASKPTREEIMAAYNGVYGMLATAKQNNAVGKRLADLHMEVGQDLDVEGVQATAGGSHYSPAVAIYEKLLLEADETQGIDEVLYQLARAHDLEGQTKHTKKYLNRLIAEYPQSSFIAEAHFRRAELYFSQDDYRAAAGDYQYVVQLGEQSPYFQNASYMLGWSEFKRSRFEEGLQQFFAVLDNILTDQQGNAVNVETLDSINTELLEDSFRVVTLALSYLDGAQTLADQMRKRGKPGWQYLAYQRLANDYFQKERYLDNVATWQTFIEHNSLDQRAPAAHIGMIKTLIDAGFPSDVVPKKKEFITRYGIYSNFWSHHPASIRQSYIDTLHAYLGELAKLAHAQAQGYLLAQEKLKRSLRDKDPQQQRTQLFAEAANWYEEMIVTFPEDPRTAEFLFLLGESYTESGEGAKAVAAYQRVVREFPDYQQANEAGYAAILGLSELIASAPQQELELWQRLKIDAQIEFALLFSGDERAPAVQIDAADTLFTLKHTVEAIDLAENMLAEWPDEQLALRQTALRIIGHGKFELQEYEVAESAYAQLLDMQLEADEYVAIKERLLATVYKQGELAEAAADTALAVHHWLRLAQIDPAAELTIQGHFDAIGILEGAGELQRAADLLAQFRTAFPAHELAADVDIRLANLYERSENWSMAAAEFAGLAKSAADVDTRRRSLYRAAELYLQLDNSALAIEHFRDYAHTYEQPWNIRLEAMHNMDLLYQKTSEADKRRFWLNKKIQLHRTLGKEASPRATYLAAEAQLVFAIDARDQFRKLALTHPLKRSLRKKQSALKKSVKAFESVAEYEVADFSSAATFEIADLYAQLSKSIYASDRPKNLNALELDQYEILLEEQAFPFEEQAITLHEINMRRAWSGSYDEWVAGSFKELARLMPGRFNKQEVEANYALSIH